MARSKTSKAWMHEHVTDAFVRRARREGHRSRAAYKLKELATQDRLIRPGMTIVDLGAAPGGWSQVAAEMAGPQGQVIAVDILEMVPVPGVAFVRGDFGDEATLHAVERLLAGRKADLVLSDMAPNISGIAPVDQARAERLGELVLEFACKWLKPGGNLVVKSFQGSAFERFRGLLRQRFRQVLTRKPQASRGRSSEIYLLGKGLIAEDAPRDRAPAGRL
jgi:23S rRNA (uridine2552-2'-O)-methyltransferase